MRLVKTDVLVIGAGAAGSIAAIKSSEFTKKIIVRARQEECQVDAIRIKIPIAFW